jgi:serine phosphatase RsbU (regulator of sigma subunit)/anti-sigma regulatory factor (Ser/Thr protein kinase)
MATLRNYWQRLIGKDEVQEASAEQMEVPTSAEAAMLDLDLAPNDPLAMYFQNQPGVVDLDKLLIDSSGLRELRNSGAKLVVPLVSQGELIGLISLGTRLSEQEYSADDRKLLGDLAAQAAPAVRVAQLAREQQAEARERERLEQELRVASLIQQTLLPQDVPDLPGYEISAYYQPAREVGGDFYDFLYFDDGQVGVIVGDVTDKGVPAALVMATTRTLLRAAAERLSSPGKVLERVNTLLHPDIPARMFVTCLYALLDPASGRLLYANAGHDLPYRRREDEVDELRATGMPLGLMPDMNYEERQVTLAPGETVLFHSDGLVEAHNKNRELFGFPRLQQRMADHPGGSALIGYLLDELAAFTGDDWEQEDDVTLVTLQCLPDGHGSSDDHTDSLQELKAMTMLGEFSLPSEPGNERQAMEEVVQLIGVSALSNGQLDKLKTAVAEATMNAMEHGNNYQADMPVEIEVLSSDKELTVRITDHGGGQPIPNSEVPDLEAKLAGEQSPRGWGLFLIQNMVDEMNVTSDDTHHTIELIVHIEQSDGVIEDKTDSSSESTDIDEDS